MPASEPSPAETSQAEEIGHPQRWTVLVVLCAVAFMAQLDLFIVNVALPRWGARSLVRALASCRGC